MRRDDVRPYAVPPLAAINPTEWIRVRGDTAEPIDDYVPDWDQNTELHFKCVIAADVESITELTGISDTALNWSVGWYVPETGLAGPSMPIAVDGPEVDIDLIVPPRLTGNSIRLTRRLILARVPNGPESPLRAHIPGSILWSDEKSVRLSGTGAAFPTEIIDFAKVPSLARLARNSWYLDLPDSVEQPVLGGLLLMINSSDHALASAVSTPNPNEQERMLVQMLQESVADHLVRWALTRWDELKDLDDTSVGSVARVLTERILPDPENWTSIDLDTMELHAKIIEGARRIGLGRVLG